ncbi:lipopolysaccharide biosynthesis protein [Pseudomonas sp. SC11]|uniref:lipopolysaccharide biosynthesis protein n=1 Tax=Pseudomonas sp. SC11 TaxID=326927 RepID=UPI00399BF42D
MFQLFIVTGCIQGGVIISQFLIAPFVDPAVVGVVRSLETVLALVVLAGSLGMQSIAVRDTAACKDVALQQAVLRQVFVLVGLTSMLVMFGIFVAHAFVLTTAISTYVFFACGLVLVTNLLRTSTGFAQGAKAIHEIYLVLMVATAVGVVLHVTLTWRYGIQGWISARYVTELLCLTLVWWRMRAHVVPSLNLFKVNGRELMALASSGVTVNASLFVRLLVDSLPVLMLTALHVRTEEIGFFGLANLSLVLGLLPLAIIAQRAIPDLVEVLGDPPKLAARFKAFLRSIVLVSLTMAAALIIAAAGWLLLVGGQYHVAAQYVLVLALSLPLKAAALGCGTMLVALRVFGLSLKVNIIEGMLVLLILYLGIPQFGAWAGAAAYLAGGLLSVVLLLSAVKVRLASVQGEGDRVQD